MAKATQTKTKTTVKITPQKNNNSAKSQKRCPTCGAFRK